MDVLRDLTPAEIKWGMNWRQVIGAMGGRTKSPNKGFGSDRERAKTAGRSGGLKSKRKPLTNPYA